MAAETYPQISNLTITTQGVYKLLTGLNTQKATGPDNLSACLLKESADHSVTILQVIFQRSLETGIVPDA
jgi:hypothetical protein